MEETNMELASPDYKLLVDPALRKGTKMVKRTNGIVLGCEDLYPPVEVLDPRFPELIRRTRKCAVDLPVPNFRIDKNYVGKPPSVQVTILNLNDNVDKSFLDTLLLKFGPVEKSKILYHPVTKKHLQAAAATFKNTHSAKKCVEQLNNLSVMGKTLKVFLDPFEKEYRNVLEKAVSLKHTHTEDKEMPNFVSRDPRLREDKTTEKNPMEQSEKNLGKASVKHNADLILATQQSENKVVTAQPNVYNHASRKHMSKHKLIENSTFLRRKLYSVSDVQKYFYSGKNAFDKNRHLSLDSRIRLFREQVLKTAKYKKSKDFRKKEVKCCENQDEPCGLQKVPSQICTELLSIPPSPFISDAEYEKWSVITREFDSGKKLESERCSNQDKICRDKKKMATDSRVYRSLQKDCRGESVSELDAKPKKLKLENEVVMNPKHVDKPTENKATFSSTLNSVTPLVMHSGYLIPECSTQQQFVSQGHCVTSQPVSGLYATYNYPDQYKSHITNYGNQYFLSAYVAPTSYAPPGVVPQQYSNSVRYIPSMGYYSGQYVQPLPSVYDHRSQAVTQRFQPSVSNHSGNLGMGAGGTATPNWSSSRMKLAYLQQISVADFDTLTKSILQQVTSDLKQILTKDVYKRMVHFQAFKAFEEWWQSSKIIFCKKSEKNKSSSVVSTVPWDVLSRYIPFKEFDTNVGAVNGTNSRSSMCSPLKKLPGSFKRKRETVDPAVSETQSSKKGVQIENKKNSNLSTTVLDRVNSACEPLGTVNCIQSANSCGKYERGDLNVTGAFEPCIDLGSLPGDFGITRDCPLWNSKVQEQPILASGDEKRNRMESKIVGGTLHASRKDKKGIKRDLSVAGFENSGSAEVKGGENFHRSSMSYCNRSEVSFQSKVELHNKYIPSCLSVVRDESYLRGRQVNEKMGKSLCKEVGKGTPCRERSASEDGKTISSGLGKIKQNHESYFPSEQKGGTDFLLYRVAHKEMELPVKKCSGSRDFVSDCSSIESMLKQLAAYSKCDLKVEHSVKYDQEHVGKKLPPQPAITTDYEKTSGCIGGCQARKHNDKACDTSLNLLEPCANLAEISTKHNNTATVSPSQCVRNEPPSCNKTEETVVVDAQDSESANGKSHDPEQFSSTDECQSDQETVMADSGDELWNFCSKGDDQKINNAELPNSRIIDVKVTAREGDYSLEQDTSTEDFSPSPSSASTENLSPLNCFYSHEKSKAAARREDRYATKKLGHMIRVNLKLNASFFVKRRKSKCKGGGKSAPRKKKSPRKKPAARKGGVTDVPLTKVKTDSGVQENISKKSQEFILPSPAAHTSQVMEASQALIALASSLDCDKSEHVMQKIVERNSCEGHNVSSENVSSFNSSVPLRNVNSNSVNLTSTKQVVEEHSYCLPMIVHTNDRQYMEAQALQSSPPRSYQFEEHNQTSVVKCVRKKRKLSEEVDILNSFWHSGIDDEDIFFLKQSYQRLVQSDEVAWLKSIQWDKHPTTSLVESGGNVRTWGSARTEVYQKTSNIEKFMNFFNSEPQLGDRDAPDISLQESKMIAQSNKETKCFQRRLLNSMADADCAGGDLLKLNQLKFRKKHLKFARSKIHNFGLFAGEPIGPDELVIEYVGEKIRPNVCEIREGRYAQHGIGSSYMFRIDSETVIDATMSGNFARFINHSCNPNCYAKVITVEGQKKIVIYSKLPINVNEEITYDYKFPIEEEKIPCFCMSSHCRGYLN